jgi:hypothetical protein
MLLGSASLIVSRLSGPAVDKTLILHCNVPLLKGQWRLRRHLYIGAADFVRRFVMG